MDHDTVEDKAQVERRKLTNGFGLGLSRAFEIALVPLFLGLIGYALDRWLGTVVAFTVVLSVLGLVGTFAKLYYGYRYDMQVLEAAAPWAPQPRGRIAAPIQPEHPLVVPTALTDLADLADLADLEQAS